MIRDDAMIACDICGCANAQVVLTSSRLDGPLVRCPDCGFRYVGERRSQLVFGGAQPEEVAERLHRANAGMRPLRLQEERRLALLDAQARVDFIRQFRRSGKLLELGCARGDFLRVARRSFDVFGVEPNPELADDAASAAPVYRDVIENLPWTDFDAIASFHVIEHVDSPRRFIQAAAERLKPGGLLVIETPNIDSLPFRVMQRRWRQFIPEHYFFFDSRSMTRLLNECGFKVERIVSAGKHASAGLIVNRLARYFGPLRLLEGAAAKSSFTFRVNPLDIMIAAAFKVAES